MPIPLLPSSSTPMPKTSSKTPCSVVCGATYAALIALSVWLAPYVAAIILTLDWR